MVANAGTIVLERFRDEMGDWRLCLLSPFGGRVHAPWTLAIRAHLARAGEPEIDTIWSDDGIVLRLPERDRPRDVETLLPDPEEIEDLVVGALARLLGQEDGKTRTGLGRRRGSAGSPRPAGTIPPGSGIRNRWTGIPPPPTGIGDALANCPAPGTGAYT